MEHAHNPYDALSSQKNLIHKTHNFKYYLAASISLITFLVYLPSLQNEFVNWDDNLNVYENPFIRSLDLTFLKRAFFDISAVDYWRPLTWLSHALDYAVWGLNPMGHHLSNNILHAVNSFIVVLLVVKLVEAGRTVIYEKELRSPESVSNSSGDKGMTNQFSFLIDTKAVLIAAATTGLLFGLHPLHVESVAWVSERKDLLCALFFLLSIMMYVKHASYNFLSFPFIGDTSSKKDPGQSGLTKPGLRFFSKHYILSILFFAFALMSKPMAVSLPAVLLILDWHPFKRIQSVKSFRSAFIEKAPYIILSIFSSIMTILAQRERGAMELMAFVPLSKRLLVAAKALIAYLWMMIWPIDLLPFYPYPKDPSLLSIEYFSAIVIALAITAVSVIMAKKQKLLLFLWCCYVAILIPVLGIIQVGTQSMADRYTYLPSLAPFFIIGLATAWFFRNPETVKNPGIRKIVGTAVIVVMVVMSLLTIKQISIWKNSIGLWTYVIEKEPGRVPLAYGNRGLAYTGMGKLDKAIEDYDMAATLDPTDFRIFSNRGEVFMKMGQLDKAASDFDSALALVPRHPRAYNEYTDLGLHYGNDGQPEKAVESFHKAIAIDPNNPLAYGNLGVAYAVIGQYDKALENFNEAIRLDQNFADAHLNRGRVYLITGDKELAVSDFQKVCSLGAQAGCSALQASR